ncbi:MAG: hypothetical protein ACT4OX_11620 [Actinomycetota bacterium]
MNFTQRGLTTLIVLSVALTGCSGGDDAPSSQPADDPAATTTTAAEVATDAVGSYVGTVDGSDTYVAVVAMDDGEAQAFVTDGANRVDWVYGLLQGGTARLDNDGGAVLDVSFTGVEASGTFTRPGDEPLTFTAARAVAPAGLYRAQATFDDGDYVGGWIVLPDGSQRGAVRRYETPLPPGSVDGVLDLNDPTVIVPGGVLPVELVEAAGEK